MSLSVTYFSSVFRGKNVLWHRSSHGGIDIVITRSPTFWIIFAARAVLVKKKKTHITSCSSRPLEWYMKDTRARSNVQFSGSKKEKERAKYDSQFVAVDDSRHNLRSNNTGCHSFRSGFRAVVFRPLNRNSILLAIFASQKNALPYCALKNLYARYRTVTISELCVRI